MKRTKEALIWIVKLLRKNKVQFYISGGFAANIYGSPRPINDIDIDIPNKYFKKVYELTTKYVTHRPKRYFKKPWDVTYFTLKYKGQEIDISNGDNIRFFDIRKNKWVKGLFNLKKATRKKVFGIIIPIERKKDLLYYKNIIESFSTRKHQRIDVQALSD